jgi:hypothetical protein
MLRYAATPFKWLLAAAFASALVAGQALADGEAGDHVHHLKDHIAEYTKDVHWMIKQVDQVVDAYANKTAADPAKLADDWESVKIHPAIESNLVPLYASVWQGLYGVRQAIEQGKPVAEVREQQADLEHTLWQVLGAVKMAAKVQAERQLPPAGTKAAGPVATIDEIKQNLDTIVVKFTEKEFKEATSLVHETYDSRFEGIEGALIEQDAELVEDLEKDFNVTLPRQLNAEARLESVKQIVSDMKRKLDKAKALLAKAEQDKPDVF